MNDNSTYNEIARENHSVRLNTLDDEQITFKIHTKHNGAFKFSETWNEALKAFDNSYKFWVNKLHILRIHVPH